LDAQLLLKLTEIAGGAFGDPGPPPKARTMMLRSTRSVAGRRIALAEVHDISVAGGAGRLRARRYVPVEARRSNEPGALLVYFHGAGWVVGDLDSHDNVCRALAQASGMTVVAVDYRLAPEHPYPAAVEDAVASFLDIASRADEFGADPGRIGVCGD